MRLRSLFLPVLGMLAMGCASCLGADTEQASTHATSHSEDTVVQSHTRKKSMPVSLSHSVSQNSPEDIGTLSLKIRESHDAGYMTLKVESETLELIGSPELSSVPLNNVDEHSWDIRFRANDAGVHYVNVFARLSQTGKNASAGVETIKIVVGDANTAQNQKPKQTAIDPVTGEPVILMPAQNGSPEKE